MKSKISARDKSPVEFLFDLSCKSYSELFCHLAYIQPLSSNQMDEEDIFRKLGAGLKFDLKRFKKDAQKLNLIPVQNLDSDSHSQLNFFQKPKKKELVHEDVATHCSMDSLECQRTNRVNKEVVASIPSSEKCDAKTIRKQNKIFVEGVDIPEPITSFELLEKLYGFNAECIMNVIRGKGFNQLTPIQMQAIPAMMHGREILACAPTGSGKTLAFLLPVIAHLLKARSHSTGKQSRTLKALILSPTRELAEQTFRECKELIAVKQQDSDQMSHLLRAKFLDKNEVQLFTRKGSKHAKTMDLLVSTPNRIVYLLNQDPPLIDLSSVEWLVVDESDKLFEEGKSGRSFREQLGTVYSSCTNTQIRRAMFSATFAHDVQQWCLMNMDNVLQITIGGKNTAVHSVEQELKFVGNESGKLLALQEVIRQGISPPVIVFVQSKERAKELFAEMIYDGVNIDAIHADRTPIQRDNAVKSFRKGDTWILICTELMGRGIDFKGVNLVINYDFPTSAVSYIHRVGRTGRAGRKGRAISFFTDEDKPLLRSIANVIREAGCAVPEYMLKLKKAAKDERKQMARQERKRATIRTAPPDLLNAKKRKTQLKTKQTKRRKKVGKKVIEENSSAQ